MSLQNTDPSTCKQIYILTMYDVNVWYTDVLWYDIYEILIYMRY